MLKLIIAIPMMISIVGLAWFNIDDEIRTHIAENNLTKVEAPNIQNKQKVELGRMLFFDKLLSGNKDVSCATCHHPGTNSGDNLSLAIGVGGSGLGEHRIIGIDRDRIPRNSPEIFNRGMSDWHTMFWDGRVSGSVESGFITPANEKLPDGLENILAAQAMFPVTSRDEMRGEIGDLDVNGEMNELALISNAMPQSIWFGIMQRLLNIPTYRKLFKEAYPELEIEDLGFQHAANAIAAFEMEAFTFDNSPWDQYVAGDDLALSEAAKAGALLFFGAANCSSCHNGNIFSDQNYYNLGVPQFGPGKDRSAPLDIGRYAETGKPTDRFAFRTAPLRNVSITGPWMHNGAFIDLKDVIRHHLDPATSLLNYEVDQLPEELRHTFKGDETVINDLLSTIDIKVDRKFSEKEIDYLLAFVESLTDERAKNLNHIVPDKVPSGIEVENELSTASSKSY